MKKTFEAHSVVELKRKLPAISILDVKEFSSKEEFTEKIKKQNPKVKQLIETGSEFSIVYNKSPVGENKYHQVVARVSEEIRKVIKGNRDRIHADLSAYRVVDRFYVKRCNNCQKFGHYEKDCEENVCCGYCSKAHKSTDCQEVAKENHKEHQCVNCKEHGKESKGHSAMSYKCPSYVEMQSKMKKTVPYYQKNGI